MRAGGRNFATCHRSRLVVALGIVFAFGLMQPVGAQSISFESDLERLGAALHSEPVDELPGSRPRGPDMSSGERATLRALDKVSGETQDLELALGQTVEFRSLTVRLDACRYPTDNPASDAFTFLEIHDGHSQERVFRGWMIASSPALNALDHARYDIWALHCQ